MASQEDLQGELHWPCEGEFDLGSSCTQRILIDVLNIVFLLGYFLALLITTTSRTKEHAEERRRRSRDWVSLVISICCAASGVAHITAGALAIFTVNQGPMHLEWLVYIVRGLVCIVLAVSLHVQRTKGVRTLVLVWWISSSLLVSALNIKILIQEETLQTLDIVAWVMNLMLLISIFRLIRLLVHQKPVPSHSLSAPFLTTKNKEETELGKSLLSRLTFSWLNPLLRLGNSKTLVLNDIPNLDQEDGASLAYQTFAQAWESQIKDKSESSNLVLRALAKCYWKEMLLVGFYALLKTISVVTAPLMLYALVQYASRTDRNVRLGVLLVGCLVFLKIVESFSQRHWFFDSRRCGMRMRSALMAAVFQKQLQLSNLGRRQHSTGEIVNYIAVDAYRLGEFPWWFHLAWSLPIQLVLSVAALIGTVGIGALPGLVPLVIFGFLNVPFAKILQNYQYQYMVAQDQRLRATSEVLNNMKIIKLQSWEEKFKKTIDSLRDVEFKWLTKTQMSKSYGTAVYWMSPTVISAVIFAGCAVTRSAPLNASTIFTVLATLRVMSEPVRTFPEVLTTMIQVKVSLDRLGLFLLEDEIKDEDINRSAVLNSDVSIRIDRGVFSWDPSLAVSTLKDINMEVKRGQKIAVCGAVGAGKSSLLLSLLGEIPKISGSVDVIGSTAYVSQTSWIQSGTIRDNILYGKPMNKTKFKMAIKSCALDKDIDNFDHGDLTEIGQRGLNMSGGQKQRIQLARAVYNDADIYLLDDPFSAVDAHTAAILFKDCVMTALESKTVILVTHQIEFLTEADRILVMEGGKITQSGNYNELLQSGTAFEHLVSAHQSAMTVFDSMNQDYRGEIQKTVGERKYTELPPIKQNSQEHISAKVFSTIQLTEDEEKEIGAAGWKPYTDYICVSNGSLLLSLVILSQAAFTLLQLLSTYWLALAVQIPHIGTGILVGVYTFVSVISCLFVHIRSLLSAQLGLRASKAFFSGFMDSVIKAPMVFFDSTPVGRILTRASTDMNVLDFELPFSIAFSLAAGIELVATILAVAIVTWQVLIVALPVMIAIIFLQRYYLASARELVRINGTTKAPVMNYAAETSLGVATIRAFTMIESFIKNNMKLIDSDAKLFFHTIAAMEWLLLRAEALQNLTIFTSALFLVLLPPGTIAPGLVGLSLSYALTLTSTQVFFTRWYSNLENSIISVERIKQFMHIPSEPPATVNDRSRLHMWPSEGRIDLQDLKIKYRPNAPLVLKGITCTFAAGAKLGVVGRTGSGKTTLIGALFRLVDPESGRILIDELDICSIGLKDLRMKLSIIPQEPALFRGTVRSNLDPLGLYSDDDIWEALEKCQLKPTISSLPKLLDSSVSDEGENWSAGQRQLFCLGRVLLRKNKILVLDEATASIDSATDAVLQRIIRQEFSSCTVITIAHRVPTVTDSDMVMVLSYGNIVEYEKPSILMGTDSSFSKLVAEYWSSCNRKSLQNLRDF